MFTAVVEALQAVQFVLEKITSPGASGEGNVEGILLTTMDFSENLDIDLYRFEQQAFLKELSISSAAHRASCLRVIFCRTESSQHMNQC